MGCCLAHYLLKYILFIFNLLCSLCGLAILAVGIVFLIMLSDVNEMGNVNSFLVEGIPTMFIVIGSIIFVVSFLGCCGAMKENRCMTLTYASLLTVLLIAQIVIGIMVFVNLDDSMKEVQRAYRETFNQRETQPHLKVIVDSIQRAFGCCGVDSPTDYLNFTLPTSCCSVENGVWPTTCSLGSSQMFPAGCGALLMDAVDSLGRYVGGVAFGVAGVQAVGVIFAMCLATTIHSRR